MEEWIEYDGGTAQEWHRSATHIRVAPGVAVIPEDAFAECGDLIVVDLGNVATISDGAFDSCGSLEHVVWTTASAVEIGRWTFADCRRLEEIDLSNATKIGAGAFYGCGALNRVSIPSSVAVIEESAFEKCRNVTEVELGEGIQRIKERAFYECNALVRISIPSSVIDIEARAFRGCNSLVEVELNEGLQRIGERVYEDCTSLLRINIPSTTFKVGDRAFHHCHRLRYAELQEGLMTIGSQAFGDCRSLERITIPSSVTLVGAEAFYDCHNLAEVTLREGLHCIEDRAFGSCTSLDHIKIPPVALVIDIERSPSEGSPFGPEAVERSTCQLMRSIIPKTIRGKKLVASRWMQYRSPSQHEQAEAKVNEILGRRQQTEEEKILSIREWFANYELVDVTTLLELAIWNVNMDGNEQDVDAEAKQARRCSKNCGIALNTIIPCVLPFLDV